MEYIAGMLAWLALLAALLFGLVRWRRKSHSRPGKLRLINAGLSLWMLLVMLTLCEMAFALWVEHSDSFNMTNVSKRWFRRHIDAQRNALDFRDAHEFPRDVPEGVTHICFIGDSFTIGHGVPEMSDRFSDRIGALLEQAEPGEFLVFNVADPGLEIAQIESRVQALFQQGYEIDQVVYVACLNDIEAYDPRTAEHIQRLQQSEPQFFLFRDTYFLNWMYFRILQATRPEVRDYFSHLNDSYKSPAWIHYRTHLASMDSTCQQHGAQLSVAIFPFMQQLGPSYPFLEAHQVIAEYCEQAGIPVLDLEPVFRRHADENLRVNRYDAHPNERAHAIAAEAIFEQLLAELVTTSGRANNTEAE